MIRLGKLLRTGMTAVGLTLATIIAFPDTATAQMGPDYWRVHGVASNDTLNLRAGPGTSNRVVARAPNGAVFRNLGCLGEGNARWCHIETPDGRITGWASGRYLQESGAPTGGTISGAPDVTELHARASGEIEVRFASGCTALYNPVGREIAIGSSCSRTQRSAAHDAAERYLRENHPTASHEPSAASTDVNISGSGTIYGGDSLTGQTFGHKEGAYALTVSGGGNLCTGLFRHAPGTVGSEATSVHCTDGAHGSAVLVRSRSGNGNTLTMTLTNGVGGYVLF